jgi:hypothetical protein
MTAVGEGGNVVCQTIAGAGGGDITAVLPGAGLTGGASAGDATLAVQFAGSGSSTTAARSDHGHSVAGIGNTAIGESALSANTTGADNSAFGALALERNTSGSSNVAVGALTLWMNTTGNYNTAVGPSALATAAAGSFNTAVGIFALDRLGLGSNNLAIGPSAGDQLTLGSDNIYVGSPGQSVDTGAIRIGHSGSQQMFVNAVRGKTTSLSNAIPVVIDSDGQLGTISSTRRVKEDTADLGSVSQSLQRLRPVRFRCSKAFADGSKPLQYGLIAEEVAEVMPELVALGADGEPETVKYHVLPTLLLAEIQRLEALRAPRSRTVDCWHHEVIHAGPDGLPLYFAVRRRRPGAAGAARRRGPRARRDRSAVDCGAQRARAGRRHDRCLRCVVRARRAAPCRAQRRSARHGDLSRTRGHKGARRAHRGDRRPPRLPPRNRDGA